MKILTENLLFKGLDNAEIQQILNTVRHNEKNYSPGETIVHQGDIIDSIGILLAGNALGKKYTPEGEEIIVSQMAPNSIFGDVLSGAIGFSSPVTVQALKSCRVLFINYQQLLFADAPAAHKVLQNIIQNISRKYFTQNKRTDILMLKSVRSKILSYLEWQKSINNSNSFSIPFDRQELADYLEVDRSGLSSEISKLRKEGLLECKKSNFCLL
mgnify:CR=1 FL=1